MLVSVIIPMYNVENYIIDCLNSVICQTYKNLEIILINDGSTDKSYELAYDYLTKSSVKHTIINQENKGLTYSRNLGLKKASGEYVIFVDSDDMLKENCIEKFVECVKGDDVVDICSCPYTHSSMFDDGDLTEFKCEIFSNKQITDIFLKRKKIVFLASTIFRREFLIKNEIFFDEVCKYSEDIIFLWNCIFACEKWHYYNEPLYFYRRRPNSIMTSADISHIFTGIESFENNIELLKTKYGLAFADYVYIEKRWKLAVLRSSALLLDDKTYYRLYKNINGMNTCLSILKKGTLKEKLYAMTGVIHPKLMKVISRIGVRWL